MSVDSPVATIPDDTPTSDYSAGHSMDTTWFAVDAEGHVGSFVTGESGVLPWRAPQIEQIFEYAQAEEASQVLTFPDDFSYPVYYDPAFIYRQLLWSAPEQILLNAIKADFEKHQSMNETIEVDWRGDWRDEDQGYEEHLMFLSSAEPAASYLERGLARSKRLKELAELLEDREVESRAWLADWLTDPAWNSVVVVYFQSLGYPDALSLHNAGCLHCVNCSGFDAWSEMDMSRLGIFQFEWGSDVHGRKTYRRRIGSWLHPEESAARSDLPYPLCVDRLPAGLQLLIGAVRFDSLRFRDTETLRVVDHQPCYKREDPCHSLFAYDPKTGELCCTSTKAEINQQIEEIWQRAETEADRWVYRFQGPATRASVAAKRRILRLHEHALACKRQERAELLERLNESEREKVTDFSSGAEKHITELKQDIAYWESKIGQ